MKKTILFISILFLIFLTGCSKNKTNENGQRIIYTTTNSDTNPNLSLPFDNLDLTIGDEYFINPSYTKLKGYSFTYQASNDNITISELGIIKALKQGSTEVTISYSNGKVGYSKSFNVNITFGDFIPVINLSGDEHITLEVQDEFDLSPKIEFRNSLYNDAKFTFESLDESICTISKNGIIKAHNKGNARIIVSANWRGKSYQSYPSLKTYIDLEVTDSVRFLNNNEAMSDINLYTVPSFNGETYDTSFAYNFSVLVNGVREDANFTILDDSLVNVTSNTIEAKKAGTTKIELTKEVNGKT